MKIKKVLLVTEYFPPKIYGGGELSTSMLAKKLSEKGLEVTVLTSWFEGLKEQEQKDGYTIIRSLKTGEPTTLKGNLKRMFCFQKSLKKELMFMV